MTDIDKDLKSSELWAEAIFFIVAGGSTTAAAMSAFLFYLSSYPDCYITLESEVRSTSAQKMRFSQWRSAQTVQVPQRAYINEILRMSPPISAMMWRRPMTRGFHNISAPDYFVVDGHVIPRGTEVAVDIYSLHHNEDYFPEPFTFKPERWLDETASSGPNWGNTIIENAFAPFMVGSRSCPGKAMAHLEISLTIARTLWRFDFKVATGREGLIGAGYRFS
ncbi:cytochrome P450 [Nemania sp. FL0031]|nr:cytochrome P450 [Nemania sp. FL0031]